jgi:hypothetical protein
MLDQCDQNKPGVYISATGTGFLCMWLGVGGSSPRTINVSQNNSSIICFVFAGHCLCLTVRFWRDDEPSDRYVHSPP